MPVALSSLRIEAELDPSKYVAGAQQKAAADQQMVASGEKVAGSVDATQRRLGESSTAVERLARSIDPAYNAQQRLGTATQRLDLPPLRPLYRASRGVSVGCKAVIRSPRHWSVEVCQSLTPFPASRRAVIRSNRHHAFCHRAFAARGQKLSPRGFS